MSQQVIQVGAEPNDGQGTPLRTSFIYTNQNFTELYARAQTSPPTSLIGQIGDQAGWYAYDSNYFYYCFANYDGTNTIWAQIAQIGNVTVNNISSGTSNIKFTNISGNAVTSVNGTPNVVVVASTGQYVAGLISAAGNVTGNYILGNGSRLTGLNPIYNDANVTALLSNFGSNAISSTGNITGGNVIANAINSGNTISAAGNIVTAGYFIGNFVGNIVANITNIPGPGGAVVFNDGAGNVAATAGLVFNNSGPNTLTVLGSYSATSNVVSGNVNTGGIVSASGNIIGGNINTVGVISATGNIRTGGIVSATGNITGGNINTAGLVSATGNVTGNYLRASLDINAGGNVSATVHTGTAVSVTGNVTGGNIIGSIVTGNSLSVSGNIAANNISVTNFASVPSLTGTTASLSGNITGGNLLSTGIISATSDVTAGNVLTGGTFSATGTATVGNLLTGGLISASGNITGGNITLNTSTGNIYAHDVSAVGGVFTGTVVSATGNVRGGNINTGGLVTATGNITGGNLSVGTGTITVGNIINANGNAVGNIGSETTYFNTVFAQATSAQYADLAEIYSADADYTAGTVVVFGGEKEITISTDVADERVAGVISTNPAHLMNAAQLGLPVALRGRVPVQVDGPVNKGDSLVTSSIAGYAQSVGRSRLYGQAVFAKSLETNLEDGKKIITAVII